MKLKFLRLAPLAAAMLSAIFLYGCGYRPETVSLKPDLSAVSTTPAPSEVPVYTVEYRLGEETLKTETVSSGSTPAADAVLPDGLYLVAWTDSAGRRVDPMVETIGADTVYYALARPVLRGDTAFLFPDEYGLLRPESAITHAECAAALCALAPDISVPDAFEAAPDEPLTHDALKEMLDALFDPEIAAPVLDALPETESVYATRAEFAFCFSRLLDTSDTSEQVYYPDAAPTRWAAEELYAAAKAGPLVRDTLLSMTRDGFLWFGGYLYRLDDNGYFLTDTESDGLYFDKNGRYTSGNAELDGYVAQTLTDFMQPDSTRLDDLKTIYCHVKNDFRYLTRNYYDSGATGWDIEEALTIFRTNKGNCYCYAGAFCALARGLGYNARTYSGTIGTQDQPHAWTEITLDGNIYICDPEIEMNYWLLEMYTDNFMMLRENSLGWNYQSVGRT